ncbi:MAG: hypothetical protein ACXVZV_16060, partial [Terriglobales bacterium]
MKKAIAALTLCVVLGTSSLGWANDAKISPDLRGYNSSSPVPVVVQYVPGTNMNCSGLLGLLGCVVSDVLKVGGTVLNLLPVVNGVLATVDGSGIQSLSNDSNVVYISRDRSLGLMADTGTAAVNAPVAWKSNYTGSGIAVALIDSGVNA